MADTDTAPARPSKLRGRLTILLVVLACLGVTVSGVAIWLHDALLDTEHWVEITGPIIDDPDVQATVADFVGREVVTALELESRLGTALPDEVSMLAAPLALGVQDVITEQTREIVASDTAREVWIETNRIAHEKIVELLRGEAGVLYAQGDEVRLNLLPIVSGVVAELRLRLPQLFPGIVSVPPVGAETPALEAVAQFEAALGRDLADDFGQITLVQDERIERAQRAVEVFDRAVWLLIIVTVGLIAAALLLSTRRLRTALHLGAGTAIALGIVLLVDSWLEDQLVAAIGDGPGTAAARTTITTVVADFTGFLRMLLIAAVVVAIAAYAVARRDVVAAAARGGAAVATRAGSSLAGRRSTTGVLAQHLDGFRLAGVLVGAVLLLIILPPWWGGLLLIAAVAGYELLLSWLTHAWPWSLSETERDTSAEAA
ncbi:MAG TPA: hypothetical protein VLA35_02285 [Thermoleophilia bacterium]|nr:hypothetical protein [Thermoleophilia bacterium]